MTSISIDLSRDHWTLIVEALVNVLKHICANTPDEDSYLYDLRGPQLELALSTIDHVILAGGGYEALGHYLQDDLKRLRPGCEIIIEAATLNLTQHREPVRLGS